MAAVVVVVLPATSAPRETGPAGAASAESAERLRVDIVESYPHDPGAFTQGFELRGDSLYESTGRYEESDVRVVDWESGAVEHRVELPDTAFGEGLTLVDDTVWQLTWHEGTAFRRDAETLEETGRVSYDGEGWGLCYDDAAGHLVMSDGTDELTFRDPRTFEPLSTTVVTLDGEPLDMLNELECAGGAVWANVWQTDDIVRIDPASGIVEAVADASGLLPESDRSGADVLNGIAAVPDSDTFLLTGKLWPHAFQVEFVPR
ncbi:glutaminyl-peptide cyclotransferase [Lipingzhangella halophila]|uniref:Glutaminyl-peptide cyclotransferase n=1 Tax=Lipingzhangella halophila TaxID=1783352 RepID=A0A7W7W0L7_9ACTN|nr:glutaminyl-peptide cyclotransferase [Lipingzhangella halophila]MBB4929353.1 glutaminyl-peptide cyclotransferase [Lipingzhangella halophila]